MAVAWFFLLRPPALGGSASYVILSGTSMEPHLRTGDLVIVQQADQYRLGDVVAYRVPAGQPAAGSLIVHRIVGGDATKGFVMQGDNKTSPDPWRPTAAGILGRSWLELPGSGALLATMRRPLVLAVLLGGLAGLWVLTCGSPKPSAPVERGGIARLLSRRRRRSVVPEEVTEP